MTKVESKEEFTEEDIPIETGICSVCGKDEMVTEVVLDDLSQGKMCHDCCGDQGFCFGCGNFSAGQDEFEFSNMGNYCGSCQEQINGGYDD